MNFQLFHFHAGEPILITPEGQLSEKGILQTQKLDETKGFQRLGHLNWTICTPLNHFCSGKFSNFSLSYWEANSYYPGGPIMQIPAEGSTYSFDSQSSYAIKPVLTGFMA